MIQKTKKSVLLSLAVATTVSMVGNTQAFAFGEYTQEDGTKKLNSGLIATQDYKTWYDTKWNQQQTGEMDSGKVVLTPGKNEKSLNFAWYSKEKGNPQIRISENQDMSQAKIFTGTVKQIEKNNLFNTYTASNKVVVENYLEENKMYYYQYSIDGQNWSEAKKYQTHSFSDYQAILVGDPQIGASGSNGQGTKEDTDIAVNTYAWNKTLNSALGENGIAKNASFILSAGDQIDYSDANNYAVREQEYAGYLYPEVLRNVPVSTTIGNHESKGDDYSYHYNNPNSSKLGATESGGDYYYSYGDALYIVLNSNNRNVEEHRHLMAQAVKSHEDAKWKIVMFHHDIYGSGSPHSDVDGANLRILFAPLMDEFNIDMCLTGHDHSYARTYQILDGKVIETEGVGEGVSNAVNPEGTLYIAAGSATGSKFYTLNTTKQYYLAERSNTPVPTFSTLDVSSNELTLKTYDYEGNKYANDVSIRKTDGATSIIEEKDAVKKMDLSVMTSGSKMRIQDALKNVDVILDTRDDRDAVNELTNKYNTDEDPVNYYGYAQNGYGGELNSQALKKGYSTLLDKTLYENNTNAPVSADAITNAYANLTYAQKEVVTITEFTELENQFVDAEKALMTAIVGNKKGEYKKETVDAFKKALENLKGQADEAKITKSELTQLSTKLADERNKFAQSANEKDFEVRPEEQQKPNVSHTPNTNVSNNGTSAKSSNSVKTGDDEPIGLFGVTGITALAIAWFLKRRNK
ncbi:purple acid phosphatase family protein [Faecalimonas sp.]